MERPSADTTAYFEAALPDDPRARRGVMFGHPCAFVNGNMFFGTFEQSVVARVGPERAAELSNGALFVRHFEPMPGRPWKDYVQVMAAALPAAAIAELAAEALEWTAALPPKRGKDGGGRRGSNGAGPGPVKVAAVPRIVTAARPAVGKAPRAAAGRPKPKAKAAPAAAAPKAVAKKSAAAPKVPAKKAPAPKAAAPKVPAKKAPVKKAPAKKAAAPKVPAKKSPAATPAKKAPARKPAKKAPSRR